MIGADTEGAAVVLVVVVAWRSGWLVGVVLAGVLWCFGVLECSPVRINTSTRTSTAPTAAAGPPSRRGRWSMERMTRSSLPVMKVAGTGSGLASSKVSGFDGFGGGTGGTGGLSASVRRTVDEPETRNALAGKADRSVSSAPSGGCVRISSSVCS